MVGPRRRRALISVTDKSGLTDLARGLQRFDYEILASGGTAGALREAGVEVIDVEAVTGQAEILGGRVKTLHPAIHAGILAKRAEDLEGTGYEPIDLVVVNLYDFASAVETTQDEAKLVESIDIGGPTMLRAAAKNFARVAVISSPAFYEKLLGDMEQHDGETCPKFRKKMARAVFQQTSRYDELITRSLFEGTEQLRYGENPHQSAWWSTDGGKGLADLGMELHGGKELSYNNILDIVGALKLGIDLPEQACAILKHSNPCGVGVGETPAQAFERAFAADPVSAFGGIVWLADAVDGPTAEALAERFLEVVLAPAFDDDAGEVLARKKNLRWLSVDLTKFNATTKGNIRRWGSLVLAQSEDEDFPELASFQLAAGPTPDDAQRAAAELAWRVCKHVKSNAIVLCDATGTLGIGAGQMSRVDSSKIAVEKAREHGHDLSGCIAASDGFFPFADGVEALAAAGARVIIQPGGSMRDAQVIEAAERLSVSLLLTGTRHFRH